MSEFTIAHLTDAHLPLHGGFGVRELMSKRGLSALNWMRRRRKQHKREIADALQRDVLAHAPEHVVMTGDVVNFGLEREFAGGAAWLAGFGPEEGVSFVPGNHEAMVAGAEAARETTFAPFTRGDDGFGWPWLRRRGPVALIGVSTSIATPPFYAQGEAGAAQIAGLRAHLAATRGACRIVAIHHPPTDIATERKALRDRRALAAAIAAEGAELVLHGHDHKNELSWIDSPAGRIPVLGAPAASTPRGSGRQAAEWRLLTLRPREGGYEIGVLRRAANAVGAFEDRGRFILPPPSRPAPAAG